MINMTSVAVPHLPEPGHNSLVSPDRFKQLFRAVPSAVSIIAIRDGATVHATTVSAFTSLSVDPPMVMLALDRRSAALALLMQRARFALNVLSHDQADLALACATKGPGKLPADHWRDDGGIALLAGAAAWAICRTDQILEGGDHRVVLAFVEASSVNSESPLVYQDRAFHRLHRLPS